jgi:hypothetical protein
MPPGSDRRASVVTVIASSSHDDLENGVATDATIQNCRSGALAGDRRRAGIVWTQFRGGLTPGTQLTLLADRAGLVIDPGSKVTYNGWRSVEWLASARSTWAADPRRRYR